MRSEILNSVRQEVFSFSKEKHIDVSPVTVELLSAMISAIIEDPHPMWRGKSFVFDGRKVSFEHDRDATEILASAYVQAIPQILNAIAKEETRTPRRPFRRRPFPFHEGEEYYDITAFDFLHWFAAGILESDRIGNCIIRK
jgi:hypothetical protein